MPFEQGNKYGKHTKRGQARITFEVKDKLASMSDEVFEKLEEGIKKGDFRFIQLWFHYRYGKPRQSTLIDIQQQETPIINVESEYSVEELSDESLEKILAIYEEDKKIRLSK